MASLRATVRAVVLVPLWCSAVFVSAGKIGWVRGWIWLAAFGGGMAALALLARRSNPGLLEARANLRRKDTKPFDKVFLAIYIPLEFLQPILAGLDAVRFRWPSIPRHSEQAEEVPNPGSCSCGHALSFLTRG